MSPFMAPPPFIPPHEREVVTDDGHDGRGRHRRVSSESSEVVEKKHWFRRPSPSAAFRRKCQYQLYGVICHEGNMNNGHYTCMGERCHHWLL
jgi:hypothetical protein